MTVFKKRVAVSELQRVKEEFDAVVSTMALGLEPYQKIQNGPFGSYFRAIQDPLASEPLCVSINEQHACFSSWKEDLKRGLDEHSSLLSRYNELRDTLHSSCVSLDLERASQVSTHFREMCLDKKQALGWLTEKEQGLQVELASRDAERIGIKWEFTRSLFTRFPELSLDQKERLAELFSQAYSTLQKLLLRYLEYGTLNVPQKGGPLHEFCETDWRCVRQLAGICVSVSGTMEEIGIALNAHDVLSDVQRGLAKVLQKAQELQRHMGTHIPPIEPMLEGVAEADKPFYASQVLLLLPKALKAHEHFHAGDTVLFLWASSYTDSRQIPGG